VAKNKLKRFSQINAFSNVIQPEVKHPCSDFSLKGKWNEDFFHRAAPLALEIGCGKGEYTIELAKAKPDAHFIGIDIKGDRIWKGAIAGLESGLYNAAFLRIQAERIGFFFASGEVSEIWITFPDPQPRESRRKKRLTSPQFLERYSRILKPGSPIHLKTDSKLLYDYTLQIIREYAHQLIFATDNLYHANTSDEPLLTEVQTYYEKMFLAENKPIHYIRFALNA
jgi:tRNA (guanine-N7-)-methyltransferase